MDVQLTELYDMRWMELYKLFRRSPPLISPYAFDWHYLVCVPHSFDPLYGGWVVYCIFFHSCCSFVLYTRNRAPCYWAIPSLLTSCLLRVGCSCGILQQQAYDDSNAEVLDITPDRVWGLQYAGTVTAVSSRWKAVSWIHRTAPEANGFCVTQTESPCNSQSQKLFLCLLLVYMTNYEKALDVN